MKSLWAPWRLQYVSAPPPAHGGCFFCEAWKDTGNEAAHLLLYRSRLAFVMMNRFPYSVGHLMVAPVRHIGNMEDATPEEAADLWRISVLCKTILHRVMRTGGCNVGINQGTCAGAGVLDHLHVHVVPRWNGDTNFMPVLSGARVMPQALDACYADLRPEFLARDGSDKECPDKECPGNENAEEENPRKDAASAVSAPPPPCRDPAHPGNPARKDAP